MSLVIVYDLFPVFFANTSCYCVIRIFRLSLAGSIVFLGLLTITDLNLIFFFLQIILFSDYVVTGFVSLNWRYGYKSFSESYLLELVYKKLCQQASYKASYLVLSTSTLRFWFDPGLSVIGGTPFLLFFGLFICSA